MCQGPCLGLMEEEVELLRYRVETVVRMFTIEIFFHERSQVPARGAAGGAAGESLHLASPVMVGESRKATTIHHCLSEASDRRYRLTKFQARCRPSLSSSAVALLVSHQ
jgi:hypothetical protein